MIYDNRELLAFSLTFTECYIKGISGGEPNGPNTVSKLDLLYKFSDKHQYLKNKKI